MSQWRGTGKESLKAEEQLGHFCWKTCWGGATCCWRVPGGKRGGLPHLSLLSEVSAPAAFRDQLYQFLCITENPTMEQARVLFRLVLAFSHMKKLTIFSRDSLGPPRIHRSSSTSIGPPRVHTFSLMSKSPFIFLSLKVTVSPGMAPISSCFLA